MSNKRSNGATYRNSRGVDHNLWSEHRKVADLTAALLEEIKPVLGKKRLHKEKYLAALKVILLNLYTTYRADTTMYVSYSRRNVEYITNRYTPKHISYKQYVPIVDALTEVGYLEGKKGYIDRQSGKARLSRMRATEKLADMFSAYGLSRYMVSRHTDEEVIILKDTEKQIIDYTDTDETRRMRAHLKTLNAFLSTMWIDLHAPDEVLGAINEKLRGDKDKSPIDFTRTTLRRVFNNGSFQEGGRFYHGWWQDVPREYRKYIQIEARETVEDDFSGMHIRMLYAQEGLPLPKEDVYAIGGIDPRYRDTIKAALNIMINAESREQALKPIKRDCKLPPGVSSGELIDAIRKKHAPIAHYINTAEGVRLQYSDSQIAEKVMLDLYEQDIPCLCIHDSFIVQRDRQDALHQAMDKAFQEVVGIPAKRDTKITREEWEVWNKEGRVTEYPKDSPAVKARASFYKERNSMDSDYKRLDHCVVALLKHPGYSGYWQRHKEFEEAHGEGTTGLSREGIQTYLIKREDIRRRYLPLIGTSYEQQR